MKVEIRQEIIGIQESLPMHEEAAYRLGSAAAHPADGQSPYRSTPTSLLNRNEVDPGAKVLRRLVILHDYDLISMRIAGKRFVEGIFHTEWDRRVVLNRRSRRHALRL